MSSRFVAGCIVADFGYLTPPGGCFRPLPIVCRNSVVYVVHVITVKQKYMRYSDFTALVDVAQTRISRKFVHSYNRIW